MDGAVEQEWGLFRLSTRYNFRYGCGIRGL